VAGISGIVGGLVHPAPGDLGWRALFVGGLLFGGLLAALALPAAFPAARVSWATAALAGLLVGVGTRLANGCTSGHGVCGVSRLSLRSIAATATFIATGAVTVALTRSAP
jgi:uncharacterized membrane protein YedE/YeeE